MRATFITLAIEDGADPEILETRATHTRKSRNAFDGYNRGLHWERTCAEIAKLRIARGPRSSAIEQPIAARAGLDSLQSAAVVAASQNDKIVEAAGVEGSSLNARIHEDQVAPSTNEVAIGIVADPRDQALSHTVLQAVLDGDYERARRLAEQWHQLQGPDGSSRGTNRE